MSMADRQPIYAISLEPISPWIWPDSDGKKGIAQQLIALRLHGILWQTKDTTTEMYQSLPASLMLWPLGSNKLMAKKMRGKHLKHRQIRQSMMFGRRIAGMLTNLAVAKGQPCRQDFVCISGCGLNPSAKSVILHHTFNSGTSETVESRESTSLNMVKMRVKFWLWSNFGTPNSGGLMVKNKESGSKLGLNVTLSSIGLLVRIVSTEMTLELPV